MTMENVEKDVISVYSNKRESSLGLYICHFHGDVREKNYYYQHLEIIIYPQEKRLMNY